MTEFLIQLIRIGGGHLVPFSSQPDRYFTDDPFAVGHRNPTKRIDRVAGSDPVQVIGDNVEGRIG